MSLLLDVAFVTIGFLLIIPGGSLFVDATVRIAVHYRLPRVLVGMTLVSVATTAPEFVVSVTGASLGNVGIAYGNAVGSALTNVGLILAVLLLGSTIAADATSRRLWFAMTGAGALVFLLALDGSLGRLDGLLLLALLALFLVWSAHHGRSSREPMTDGYRPDPSPQRLFLLFLAGAGMVVGGARLLVEGAASLALDLGVDEVVIGLTLVAVGTSAPEFVVAVGSLRRRVADVSLGNIAGANLLNFLWILGTAATIHDLPVTGETLVRDGVALLVVTLIPALSLAVRSPLGTATGTLLVGTYVLYLLVLTAVLPF